MNDLTPEFFQTLRSNVEFIVSETLKAQKQQRDAIARREFNAALKRIISAHS